MITATYSPDDNKLRLTAATRLDRQTYERLKAAGFKWAPKLEQFVAPMWTPEREDLALELAGEIQDEDSTLLDRAEMRAERFEGYRGRRRQEAEGVRQAVDAIAQRFEGGQPIILGHHSTRKALRDKEKIEAGMRRAINLFERSEYWKDRAAGAIRHAKYKERPDVRHRRIKTLEAERRHWVREKEKAEASLRLWEAIDDPERFKRKDGQPSTKLERARFLAGSLPCDLVVARTEEERWSAWDVLRPAEERWRGCPEMTVEDVQAAAREAYPSRMAYCDRWIEHTDNRLTYERLMLAEQGGYIEKPKPKKTELPLLNIAGEVSWRNRFTGDVTTTQAVGITKAQWAAIGNDYKGTVMSADGTHRLRQAMHVPGHGRGLTVIYLTDSKLHPKPAGDVVAAKAEEEAAAQARADEEKIRRLQERTAAARARLDAQAADPGAKAFQDLAAAAAAGVQVVVVDQLVPTPPPLAERMVGMAEVRPGQRVLEPHFGTGHIARAVLAEADVELVGVEISPKLVDAMRRDPAFAQVHLRCADFLECNGDLGTFDRIIMNPPFANAVDVRHVRHAATFLRPGGVLVSLCANGPRQRAALQEEAEYWEDLPAGTFKEQGTNVNTALLVIRREPA